MEEKKLLDITVCAKIKKKNPTKLCTLSQEFISYGCRIRAQEMVSDSPSHKH